MTMSTMIEFYMPNQNILMGVGRIVIRHGHLDHVLRLAIKRLLEISIDDPRYEVETKGMSKTLRTKLHKEFKRRFAEPDLSRQFDKLLDLAAGLTSDRNRLVHCVWANLQQDGKKRKYLLDGTKHTYVLPTVAELKRVDAAIYDLHVQLNELTRPLLKLV
jgi:hypothetical protein